MLFDIIYGYLFSIHYFLPLPMFDLLLFYQGYDMSTFVRRYGRYLNEKASSYTEMGYDFRRLKRGSVTFVYNLPICIHVHPLSGLSQSFQVHVGG